MRILLILFIFLAGCSKLDFYPKGDYSYQGAIPYYSSYNKEIACCKCEKVITFFKQDSKNRVWCMDCYKKLMKYR